MSRVFANDLGDQGSILGRVIPKTQKMLLLLYNLVISIIMNELQLTKRNTLYENILLSKGVHSLLLVWEIDGDTYTQIFLFHIFFQEPGGANACTPSQAVSSETPDTPLIGCLSLARLSILCSLSKSDRVVLTWSPFGYTPVGPDCPDTLPSECDSLSKHTGSLGTNRKSMSYVTLHLMPLCLTLSVIGYVSMVKWSNPGNGIAPFLIGVVKYTDNISAGGKFPPTGVLVMTLNNLMVRLKQYWSFG